MYICDETDRKIANLLMENGRMAASEVARRVGGGISERVVRYRIDRMVKEKVITLTAVMNPRTLGYPIVADVWLECESDSILDVAEILSKFEMVSYVACAIGETDVSIQLIGKDTSEVYAFVTGVIGKIHGVRKTTTSIVPLVLKDVYQWRIPPVNITNKISAKE
jgi:Lrp/AsnC family transcriptional regulator, regulator for asnA, asnC and gidA